MNQEDQHEVQRRNRHFSAGVYLIVNTTGAFFSEIFFSHRCKYLKQAIRFISFFRSSNYYFYYYQDFYVKSYTFSVFVSILVLINSYNICFYISIGKKKGILFSYDSHSFNKQFTCFRRTNKNHKISRSCYYLQLKYKFIPLKKGDGEDLSSSLPFYYLSILSTTKKPNVIQK